MLVVALPQQDDVANIGPQQSPPPSRSMSAEDAFPIKTERSIDLEEATEPAPAPTEDEELPSPQAPSKPQLERTMDMEADRPDPPTMAEAVPAAQEAPLRLQRPFWKNSDPEALRRPMKTLL